MATESLLSNAFVYLSAAVVAVPLSKRLGLGAVLGYLIAGFLIGPSVLKLIDEVDDILHFSEFGVVMLLFLIGLELNPKRLWAMRQSILGMGMSQVVISGLLLAGLAVLIGMPLNMAIVAGMGLALSSTAMALQILNEKNLMPTPAGNAGFSVLLFQDIAVIPMLALIPLLGIGASAEEGEGGMMVLQAIGVVLLIIIGGHYGLPPLFRIMAKTRVREIFTASALLIIIGIGLLMQAVGLSMALGAFLAGMLLAESEYRHALESDIEPFKGLLLGLFFIAVGMSIDIELLLAQPLMVLGLVAALLVLKALVLLFLAKVFKLPAHQHTQFAVVLSQGGEFAFVLLTVAVANQAMSQEWASLLIGVVAISMMTTPLLMILNEKLVERRFDARGDERPMDIIEDEGHPVIIAGFGRFGQIIGRLLHANGVDATILDHDPDHIDMVRKFGFKVFYGDAARLDLLRAAGADHARLLIVAVDDKDNARDIVEISKEHFPNLVIVSRAWDLVHGFELLDMGVNDIQRESFEGALAMGEMSLKRLGLGAWQAKQAANAFRLHDQHLSEELYQHFQEDIDTRANISSDERERFREQMMGDEKEFGSSDHNWK